LRVTETVPDKVAQPRYSSHKKYFPTLFLAEGMERVEQVFATDLHSSAEILKRLKDRTRRVPNAAELGYVRAGISVERACSECHRCDQSDSIPVAIAHCITPRAVSPSLVAKLVGQSMPPQGDPAHTTGGFPARSVARGETISRSQRKPSKKDDAFLPLPIWRDIQFRQVAAIHPRSRDAQCPVGLRLCGSALALVTGTCRHRRWLFLTGKGEADFV
jgi:hypothetical protein